MKSPRAFVWLPILLVILGVLVVSGGTYWYVHSQPQTPPVPLYQEATTTPQASVVQLATTTPKAQTDTTIISTSPTSGPAPLVVNFSIETGAAAKAATPPQNQSTVPNPYLFIDFGDGATASVCYLWGSNINPCGGVWEGEHTYSTVGTYIIQVIAVYIGFQSIASSTVTIIGTSSDATTTISASLCDELYRTSSPTSLLDIKWGDFNETDVALSTTTIDISDIKEVTKYADVSKTISTSSVVAWLSEPYNIGTVGMPHSLECAPGSINISGHYDNNGVFVASSITETGQ